VATPSPTIRSKRKSIFRSLAIALLVCAAPIRAALARTETVASPDSVEAKGAALEAMAQRKFGPALSAAERKLIHAAPSRALQWLGPSDDPDSAANDTAHGDKWGPERAIRPEIVVWLATDASASKLVHPSGLGVAGARLSGKLDLSYAVVEKPLTLLRCYIPDGIDLSASHLGDFTVRRSTTGAVLADTSIVHGDVSFLMGDYGPISFFRARIDGTVDFTGARIMNPGQDAVNLSEANIGGDLIFHEGFSTNGIVYLRLAKVGHDVSFHDAEFTGDGELDAERAVIEGTFYWVEIKHTPRTMLDLENARAGAIWDDEASWPTPGNLNLSGFVYGEIAGGPPAAPPRLRWLALQPPGYASQPYRQLATVLSDQGREQGATEVRIAKEVAQRRFGHMSRIQRAWSLMLQVTIGFGYRPLRALWWIGGFVGLGTILFGWGYHARIITPTEEGAYGQFVQTGEPPPHYPVFNPLIYSLENFLPVVDLYQDKYWRPNPRHAVRGKIIHGGERLDASSIPSRMLRWYLWLHILAGWTITPLLFAGLSGLVGPH
jgi:hypothetical protein